MKTKALMALVVAGAMTFTACNKKVDEKTMADINQFGTDWSAMGEKANQWGAQLTETTQHAKEFAAKQTEMMNNMVASKDETMKTKMQDVVKSANDNVTTFDGMTNEYNTFKTSWDQNTQSFTEWQGKVTKGEVTGDDAMKGLNDWKNKMTEAQQKMDTWNTAYNATKDACDKNMAMMDEMSKSMTTNTTGNTNGGGTTHGKMKK
jgi:hypothetical protein